MYYPRASTKSYGALTEYVVGLQKHLNQLHSKIYASLPDPDYLEGTQKLQPGDWVMLRKHQRKGLEPRWSGPYRVVMVTPTAVKLEGKEAWVHASHCKHVHKAVVS